MSTSPVERSITVRRSAILVLALLGTAALLAAPPAAAQCPETSVSVAGFPVAGEEFGTSVALRGELAVVGSPGWAPPGGSDVGRVTLSLRSGGLWFSVELLRPASIVDDDRFGQSVAINEAGDVIVVGAPGHDSGANDGGLTVIYERDVDTGNYHVVEEIEGLFGNGFFGWSVAASGDFVAVGEPGGAFTFGAVQVYQRISPGSWVSDFLVFGTEAFALFGWDVDLRGDLLVVGVPLEDDDVDADADVGAAIVYRRETTGWSLRERLHLDQDGNELYGWSVGVHGERLVVGAPGVSTTSSGGWASVYEWNGANYQSFLQIITTTVAPPYRVGGAVAVGDLRGAFAAPGWDASGLGLDTGQVFVLGRDPLSNWFQPVDLVGTSPSAGAEFGFAVAIGGMQLIVGHPSAAPGGLADAGLVTAYDLEPNISHADLGNALAGFGGQAPVLEPAAGFCDVLWEQVVMFGARPSSLTYIVLGFTALGLPFKGGTMMPSPDILIPVNSLPNGTLWSGFTLPTGWPAFSLWWQFWVKDPDGVFGWAATNALRADIPPF